MSDNPQVYHISRKYTASNPTHYSGFDGYRLIEQFPHCGNNSVHVYVMFAVKYLLRLGRKDEIRTELKKAITYLARAYYTVDPDNYDPDDISISFNHFSEPQDTDRWKN